MTRTLRPGDASHYDRVVVHATMYHQSPSGCRFTTRVRLLIVNRLAGFSATAILNAARARASVRHRSDPGLLILQTFGRLEKA
jgi:hypothetical protein